MRIFIEDLDKAARSVMLLLTPDEAAELRDTLEHLLANPGDTHEHVCDQPCKREITVAIYTPENVQHFARHVVALIESDE